MSAARDDILAALRAATGGKARETGVAREFVVRCASPRANLVPERGRPGPAGELIARFTAEAETAGATLARIAERADIPQAVADYLAAHDLPGTLRAAPALKDVPWPEQTGLSVDFGRPEAADAVGVSQAVCGIAETGSLMMLSGPQTPMSLNFLPDVHIVVLHADSVVGAYEDGWALLRRRGRAVGFMPRAVTWITGPSRSADIEMVLLLGVHGPRRLHILMVDGQAD